MGFMIQGVPLDKAPKQITAHSGFRFEWCISLAFPTWRPRGRKKYRNTALFLPTPTDMDEIPAKYK